MKYKYTESQLIEACKVSFSIAGVMRELGIPDDHGGARKRIDKWIEKLGINTSHFTGQGHSKGRKLGPKTDIEEYFSGEKRIGSNELKKRILGAGLKPYQCECCKNTDWMGSPIPLELHHINGDRLDNKLENLSLLCANCHAQTDNFRGSKKRIHKKKSEHKTEEEVIAAINNNFYASTALKELGLVPRGANYERINRLIKSGKAKLKEKEIVIRIPSQDAKKRNPNAVFINKCKCGCDITRSAKLCEKCSKESQRRVERPTKEVLEKEIADNSFLALSRKYGVSDNAIRRWCKAYGINPSKGNKKFNGEKPSKEKLISMMTGKFKSAVMKEIGVNDRFLLDKWIREYKIDAKSLFKKSN